MRIIQSFWSKPYSINQARDIYKGSHGPWVDPKYNLMSWTLSCLKFREFYDKVELITDDFGKKILLEDLGLPYTRVDTQLDDYEGFYKPELLWSLGKIYTYSLQKEPFIHADGDFIIWKRFPRRVEEADLLAQSRDKNLPVYSRMLKVIRERFDFIPKEFLCQPPYNAFNCGIIGGSDLKFFQDFYKKVTQVVSRNSHTFEKLQAWHLNVIFEQYYFYQLAEKAGKKVECLFRRTTRNYSECMGFHMVPHFASYIHPISDAKSKIHVCRQIENLLRYEYPAYHARIEQLVKSITTKRTPKISYEIKEQDGVSQGFLSRLRNSKINVDFLDDRMLRTMSLWRSMNLRQLFSAKFRLSGTAFARRKTDREGISITMLTYLDPHSLKIKTLSLDGWDNIISYFRKPKSLREMISEFKEYPHWKEKQRRLFMKAMLFQLARFMFYYGAIEMESPKAQKASN